MIFALFTSFDSLLGSLLAYIPFYQLIKLLILIWLQNPMTDGATKMYDEWIEPFGRKYEKQVKEVHAIVSSIVNLNFDNVKEKAQVLLDQATDFVVSKIPDEKNLMQEHEGKDEKKEN